MTSILYSSFEEMITYEVNLFELEIKRNRTNLNVKKFMHEHVESINH